MTEAEWLASRDLTTMVRVVATPVYDRKLRLFAVACARSVATFVADPQTFDAVVDVAERFADGLATDDERDAARPLAAAAAKVTGTPGFPRHAAWCAYYAVAGDASKAAIAASEVTVTVVGMRAEELTPWSSNHVARRDEGHRQSDTLRDIFGNPFRPVALDRSWLTSTVVALAEGIYQERAFDRLPILADALMDAGCDNDDVLNHCRGDGPHVRGCWVVDLLTGRA
jgi:hypothetical protein